jgi:leucyl-tRNA synthetase
MIEEYDFGKIEKKWQDRWLEDGFYRAPSGVHEGEKFYALDMFAYTSGSMHMGNARTYTLGDVIARYQKRQGYKLLHPTGWDAFGLPADMAAVKHGIHPSDWTEGNIARWKQQFVRLGMPFDWDAEVTTCRPDYYRWTQWLFLRLFERGLAYRKYADGNWCPSCRTVLANEQVVGGRCERCESIVEKKPLDQWFFKITDYADKLLEGLDRLDGWPEKVKVMQRNWIGRSEGAELLFPVKDGSGESITVFTTRADTVYGATYMILSPEHPMLPDLVRGTAFEDSISAFAQRMSKTERFEREAAETEKEGMFTGKYAVNPFTGEDIPIWTANYVLMDYGTGAIMGVPAHDQRDLDFARKYGLPVKVVVQPARRGEPCVRPDMADAYTEAGYMVNSGQFDGLPNDEAAEAMIQYAQTKDVGKKAVSYHLRDWCISRQRYWGAPIPIIHCDRCGMVPAAELPVELTRDVKLTGKGPSPLSLVEDFVNVPCPKCGGSARRDTDTLDTFVCSSWYFLRFANPHYSEGPFDDEAVKKWLPVDQYFGGIEHAILHLMYARFFTKALFDMGLVDFDEPFTNLFTPGMVTRDGRKMSKSKGNAVEVDDMLNEYGADTLRLFVLFAGPPERDLEWSDRGMEGMHRFLKRLWRLSLTLPSDAPTRVDEDAGARHASPLRRQIHRTIRKVTEDIERIHFNTAISAIIELLNAAYAQENETADVIDAVETMLLLLAPFAPHITEELWHRRGYSDSVHDQPWPTFDAEIARQDDVTVVIQINGKLRDRMIVPTGTAEDEVRKMALGRERIKRRTEDKKISRIVVVPDKLVNIAIDE